ncbi:MAG: transketolase [Eggerthellaceae bacterium]|jgi:transketolase|nr:transketolase [Eggerthellaceae bacterium]MDR2715892.1 transketolase [Coriobacteriaceae bacterium]
MDTTEIRCTANEMRKDILRMIAQAKSGHPGGSLSCIDLLAALYFGGVLAYDPRDPKSEGRDYFFLSKGHVAPALYAVLAHAGFFPREELMSLRQLGSRLQGHPDSNLLDCVEVSTGSLGQGLSIACGTACGLRLKGRENRVFVLLGDGECQEGQVWEAANFAAHQRLGNLIAVVDANGLQIDGPCREVCDAGELGEKFAAFGWEVSRTDGHDIEALVGLFTGLKAAGGQRPHVVIASTVKGKGVSFMEGQAGWHGKAPDAEQLAQALGELSRNGVCDG